MKSPTPTPAYPPAPCASAKRSHCHKFVLSISSNNVIAHRSPARTRRGFAISKNSHKNSKNSEKQHQNLHHSAKDIEGPFAITSREKNLPRSSEAAKEREEESWSEFLRVTSLASRDPAIIRRDPLRVLSSRLTFLGKRQQNIEAVYFPSFWALTLTTTPLALSKTASLSAPPKSSQNRAVSEHEFLS
jgi:hypothetical protein